MLDSYSPFPLKTSKHPAQMTSLLLETTSVIEMRNIIISIPQMRKKRASVTCPGLTLSS